jgi:hypothetical protein
MRQEKTGGQKAKMGKAEADQPVLWSAQPPLGEFNRQLTNGRKGINLKKIRTRYKSDMQRKRDPALEAHR